MPAQGKSRYSGTPYQKKPESENRKGHARGVRAGFDKSGGVICKGCFDLRNENAALKQEMSHLKQKLKYREGTAGVKPSSGAHVPPSRIEKRNAEEENRLKKGGAVEGHPGRGRSACALSDAEEVIELAAPASCSSCECALNAKDTRDRTVIESVPVVAKKVVYRCRRGVCPKCFKVYPAKAPVLPKSLYGNSLIAQAATLHYVHGIPIGKLIGIFGEQVGLGGLVDGFHRLGRLASSAREKLIEVYRLANVKHADETGWRNDGRTGYAWLFSTPSLSIFEFKDNRSARVPAEVFGSEPLPGVLVVDRYGAYNKMPVNLQYCYAHLLREVKKHGQEFEDNADVQDFCSRLSGLLSEAMRLRSQKITEEQFAASARKIQHGIEAMMEEEHGHMGTRRLQQIFTDKRERLYHWARSREVPAENNRAERELRPLVVARKVSFGSQSDAGAKTRSSIMTLLHTVKKRLKDQTVEEWLKRALDRVACDPSVSLADLIPPAPSTPSN